jgi:3-oxoadipate enol-lactonase
MPSLPSNGINLYYETQGEGESILFIHGLGSSTRDWEYQVPELSRRYRVITFDLRGHGQSEKPPGPYSMPMFAADAVGLLQALGLASVHVVGLSLGGGVAFQLALDAPRMVKTLVILNSGPEMVLRSFKQRMAIWQRLAIVRMMGMRKMGEVLSQRLFVKPEQAAMRDTFVNRWAENDKAAYLAALRALIGWSVTARLGEITCPTLVVSADHDYTPVAFKEAYSARIPQAKVVTIADSRHVTPLDQPQELNRVLLEFWATLAHQRAGSTAMNR